MSGPISLAARAERWIESGEIELPVLDDVALRVYRETHSGELDAEAICELLRRDPVLVGDVLRLANSGFFGGLAEVRNLHHAAVRLGTRQLAALALSAGCKRLYSASGPLFRPRLRKLWCHGSATAAGACWLATRLGHRALADDAFVAGLLHDVGKLLLLRALEDLAERDGAHASARGIDEVLDTLHGERGAWLLERWGVPARIADIARHHEDERFDVANTVLCLVRFVDKVCAREGIGERSGPSIDLESLPEGRILGFSGEMDGPLVEVLRRDVDMPSVP